MDFQPHETSVDAGRKSMFVAWWSRVSPFAFTTLDKIPWPTWTLPMTVLPMTVLAFVFLWHEFEKHTDSSVILGGSLAHSIYRIRNLKAPLPEVLICGDSANGFGIDREILERCLGVPVEKASLNSSGFWEAEHLLKKYQAETRNLKVVVINLKASHLEIAPDKYTYQNGNAFRVLKSPFDFSKTNREMLANFKKNREIKKKPTRLPYRVSLRDLDDQIRRPPEVDGHEMMWTDAEFHKLCRNYREALKRVVSARSVPPEMHLMLYSDGSDELIRSFVRYCESRNIFVVFNFSPSWRLLPSFYPEGEILNDYDRRFYALCDYLDTHPNCKVVTVRDFHEIAPTQSDPDLFIDNIHLTKDGAELFTNWLARRMLKEHKILTAMQRPSTGESVAWKYVRETYEKLVGKNAAELDPPRAYAVPSAAGIKLTWPPVHKAEQYSVWKFDDDSAAWSCVKTGLDARVYEDPNPASGKWYYAVRAINGDVISDMGRPVSIVVPARIDAPRITVLSSARAVQMEWTPVENADHYSVWRYNADATWTCVQAEVRDLSFTDVPPTSGRHFYAVRTHTKKGESPLSAAVSTFVKDTMIASPPSESSLH